MDELGKLLGELHLKTAKSMLEKVERGEVDDKMLRVISQFLKENEIVYDKDLKDEHVERLASSVIEIEGIALEDSERFKRVM